MFNSPAGGAGRLFPSPVSGVVSPAAQIAEGELVIEQVSQLSSQLAQKQNLIGPGELPQDRVANLSSDLASTSAALTGKASISDLNGKADISALSSYATTTTVAALQSELNGKPRLQILQTVWPRKPVRLRHQIM